MNIVIFGATGPLGRRITQAALADGYQVTAFVRTTGRLDPHPGLREATGDVLDPGSVGAAMPGHDAVISALGHSSPSSAGHNLYPGASHIISAMQTAGVGRLIWISSHGVGDARGHSGFVSNASSCRCACGPSSLTKNARKPSWPPATWTGPSCGQPA